MSTYGRDVNEPFAVSDHLLDRPDAIAIVPLKPEEGGGWMAYRLDAPMTYCGDGDTAREALDDLLLCIAAIDGASDDEGERCD